MVVYRNQTPTMTQILLLSQMRITTVQEAVAFLRAMRPINDQIAGVLQRAGLQQQNELNRALSKPEEDNKEEVKAEPKVEKTFVPEDLSTDEGHSEKEIDEKLSKLKEVKSKTQKRKESISK